MGTTLRTLCACQGSDMQQLYKCLGWQRLLWLNPCVGELRVLFFLSGFLVSLHNTLKRYICFQTVESQKDFHVKRLAELGLLITTTTTTTQRPTTTLATTTRSTSTTLRTTTTTTREPIRIITTDRERLPTPNPPPPTENVSRIFPLNWEFSELFNNGKKRTFHRQLTVPAPSTTTLKTTVAAATKFHKIHSKRSTATSSRATMTAKRATMVRRR